MLQVLFTTTLMVAAAAATDKVFFPPPCGKYHVGKTQHIFNHTTLDDPVAPKDSNNTGTFIVLNILCPTTQKPTPKTSLKYFDHELAHQIEKGWEIPDGQLQRLWTPLQWQPPVLPGPVGENPLPTLLFSPDAGMPCSSSTMITSEMVSQGYTVLCIDHPGEPPYLKVPYGGEGVYGIPIDYDFANETFLYKLNRNRKTDFDAILELFPPLVQEFGAPFNTSTYLHFGFSMGGSIATDVVSRHDAVLAGINYDGAFIDTIFNETIDVRKPLVMFRDDQNRETTDLSWPEFQGHQTGWWKHLKVLGSHHLDFSDVGWWFDLLDLNDTIPLTGTIKATRINEIMKDFTTAFFEKVLGEDGELLDEPLPSNEWPDVLLWNKSSNAEFPS